MDVYRNFNDFLIKHRTNDNETITHTRIGDKKTILSGKYTINDEELDIFYKLYHRHVFVEGNSEYLTEKQNKKFNPILVDLDFRYEPTVKTRQHSEEHLEDIVILYIETISKKIMEVDDNITIPVYIFEKDNVNLTDGSVTKDGIHLYIGIDLCHPAQVYLREEILKHIDDVLGDLPLINDYPSVLDEGISKGHTNWQLYGSQKPANEPYKLVKILHINVENSEDDIDISVEKINFENNEEYNDLFILKNATARNKNLLQFNLKDACKEKISSQTTRKTKTKANVKFVQQGFTFNVSEIKDVTTLEKLLEALWNELGTEEYTIKETHEFLMSLPSKYYDDYPNWIQCGWALHNTDYRLFISWMFFSSQSSKFNFDDIAGYYDEWNNMKDEGVTCRSIMYWSKLENPIEYKKIRESTIDFYVEQSGKTQAEWDVAKVLFHLLKDEYRCASIKDNLWYKYVSNKWKQIEKGTSLRYSISKDLAKIYSIKADSCFDKASTVDDPQQQEGFRKLSHIFAEISTNCKKTNYKQNIMKEAAEHFYEHDSTFFDRLNKNPYLLCCKNGVIDFEEKVFRQGMPEDYLSVSTNVDYIPINKNDPKQQQIISEINEFMSQLFPDKNLEKYMWEHLASTLIGKNLNQTFNIYNGSGSNGKSKIVELMTCALGDYKGTVPTTLITEKRRGVGALSPEIAALAPIRYAVMSEPSKGEKINDGVMKEYTGEDPITGRALFQPPVTFIPQFSLVLTTNNMLDIQSNDDGVWRRIRLCDFESKFVYEPYKDPRYPKEHYPNQYVIDPNLEKKFDGWKEVFLSMLISIAFKTGGIVNDCDKVLGASNEYRQNQDYLMQFKLEKIEYIGDTSSKIRKTEVSKVFQEWYKETFGKNVPKGKELYEFLDKILGKYKNGWVGYKIKYEDVDDDNGSIQEINDDY